MGSGGGGSGSGESGVLGQVSGLGSGNLGSVTLEPPGAGELGVDSPVDVGGRVVEDSHPRRGLGYLGQVSEPGGSDLG